MFTGSITDAICSLEMPGENAIAGLLGGFISGVTEKGPLYGPEQTAPGFVGSTRGRKVGRKNETRGIRKEGQAELRSAHQILSNPRAILVVTRDAGAGQSESLILHPNVAMM
jgi:hypothetical protein